MNASELGLYTILKKFWNYTSFREKQLEIIHAVLSGHDTLALLPTGGGKSLCFQVPAMAMDGICIVISPLIALMKDQVERLVKMGIPAISLTSGLTKEQVDARLDNCIFGNTKFLYLSPERLGSSLVIERIKRMNVCLIAVDEAHCISQWGYDFRPSYLKISAIRNICPEVPVLALTATATPQVQDDIQTCLAFKRKNKVNRSFLRESLIYEVIQVEAKQEMIMHLLQVEKGMAIVYVRTRREAQDLYSFLLEHQVNAGIYHAGMDSKRREKSQQAWINNNTRVIVATNAFGMGIDKADVRLVIHLKAPSSPEAYYQEAGRAGRDEKSARAIILWNEGDLVEAHKQMILQYPPLDDIRKVYQGIANYFQLATGSGEGLEFEFDFSQFCKRFKMKASLVFNCLKSLERNGFIVLSDAVLSPSTLKMLHPYNDWNDLSRFNPAHVPLIKSLLRNYEGVFVREVRIRENEIARGLNISEESVIEQLIQLSNLKIIDFNPRSEMPRMGFPRSRVNAPSLQIDHNEMMNRFEAEKNKLDSMHAYLRDSDSCRNRVLLLYFGEHLVKDCGFCDNCKKRNSTAPSTFELKKLIMNQLIDKPMPIKALLAALGMSYEKDGIDLIRHMAAQGLVQISTSAEVSLS